MLRRRQRDPFDLSLRERIDRRLGGFRRRSFLVAVLVTAALALVGYALLGRSDSGRSATLHGWQSGDYVAVEGRPAGSCASAHPPWQYLLSADQWIVCVAKPRYACYRQRMHAMNFKPQPMRRSRFGSDCWAALAVVRKAGFLR